MIAALHHNENVNREQATTKDGMPRFAITYPKYKEDHVVRDIRVPCTYSKYQKVFEIKSWTR